MLFSRNISVRNAIKKEGHARKTRYRDSLRAERTRILLRLCPDPWAPPPRPAAAASVKRNERKRNLIRGRMLITNMQLASSSTTSLLTGWEGTKDSGVRNPGRAVGRTTFLGHGYSVREPRCDDARACLCACLCLRQGAQLG